MGFHFFPPKLLFSDHVFDQDCCNSRVYELLIKDIIHAAVEGFNGKLWTLYFSDLTLFVFEVSQEPSNRYPNFLNGHSKAWIYNIFLVLHVVDLYYAFTFLIFQLNQPFL